MEVDYEDFGKFGGEMEFGECSTSKVVQFTNLFDVYDDLIHIPYHSSNESLLLLLKYYLKVT
jgi:hypothetical protein